MNVILSIKPEFVEKIFSGKSNMSTARFSSSKRWIPYIYASRPISKIVGEFKIAEIICDTPANIWNQTKEYSGVTKSFFQQYYTGKDKGVALKIKECKQYKEAVDPTTVIANFKVPQSFIYV